MNTTEQKLIDFERRLRAALASLPDADCDSIAAELRSHVLDRIDSGASMDRVLDALGPPEDYAHEFLESYAMTSALSSRQTPRMMKALLHSAARKLGAFCAIVAILLVWSPALVIVYTAFLKLSDPLHVGLWRGERFFFIGVIDDPTTGAELLGAWILPLAAVSLTLAWLLTNHVATWALKRLINSKS